MKIIAGKYGRRVLLRPKTSATRPMSDKVREALFNVIGSVEGKLVLDAYAGSAALAFEALSRGAAGAVAIENSKTAARTIIENQKALGVGEELSVKPILVAKALKVLKNQQFDIIVADPPYDHIDPSELTSLSSLLVSDGRLIVSHTSRIAPPQLESMERFDTRTYGDSSLSFYRKNQPSQAKER